MSRHISLNPLYQNHAIHFWNPQNHGEMSWSDPEHSGGAGMSELPSGETVESAQALKDLLETILTMLPEISPAAVEKLTTLVTEILKQQRKGV
jgi:hypothetical protein